MKKVSFARRWNNSVNDISTHEYPAGWSGEVSNETAERAEAAGVLSGNPVDAKRRQPPGGRKKCPSKAAPRPPAIAKAEPLQDAAESAADSDDPAGSFFAPTPSV